MYHNIGKLRKSCSDFIKEFSDSKAIFIHYQYEDSYNHILNKLISLISMLPDALKVLIVGLPPNASYIDSHLAEHLQRILLLKKSAQCLVLFIRYDEK